LAIIQPVTLAELNKPLPFDLVKEAYRHDIMEHNTLIRYGFKKGSLLFVPDPDEESNKNYHRGKVLFQDVLLSKTSNRSIK